MVFYSEPSNTHLLFDPVALRLFGWSFCSQALHGISPLKFRDVEVGALAPKAQRPEVICASEVGLKVLRSLERVGY